jgi:hypothetical protein
MNHSKDQFPDADEDDYLELTDGELAADSIPKSRRKLASKHKLTSDEQTKLTRSLSDKGAAKNALNRSVFEFTLQRLQSTIVLLDSEIDRIAATLRFAQPKNAMGNLDIRWWIRHAEVRKPVIVKWIRKPGFPKLTPVIVARFSVKKFLEVNANKYNAKEVIRCVEHAQELIRSRDELNHNVSVMLRGLSLRLDSLEKNLVESRQLTGELFLQVGRNLIKENYVWSPYQEHRDLFPDIDFTKRPDSE